MRKFLLEIPELTPSNNRLLKKHWAVRYQEREDWYYRVKLAAQDYDVPRPAPGERRTVVIVSFRRQLVDPDNLAGGMKQLLDALVAAEILADDAESVLDFPKPSQVQVRRKKDEKTVVLITIPEPVDIEAGVESPAQA